jgi:hypothetical protein
MIVLHDLPLYLQCLQKIKDMWEYFGRGESNTAIDTEEIVV